MGCDITTPWSPLGRHHGRRTDEKDGKTPNSTKGTLWDKAQTLDEQKLSLEILLYREGLPPNPSPRRPAVPPVNKEERGGSRKLWSTLKGPEPGACQSLCVTSILLHMMKNIFSIK